MTFSIVFAKVQYLTWESAYLVVIKWNLLTQGSICVNPQLWIKLEVIWSMLQYRETRRTTRMTCHYCLVFVFKVSKFPPFFVQMNGRGAVEWKSREKNELPTRCFLGEQSPSSRDGMDMKVTCTVNNDTLRCWYTHMHKWPHTHHSNLFCLHLSWI